MLIQRELPGSCACELQPLPNRRGEPRLTSRRWCRTRPTPCTRWETPRVHKANVAGNGGNGKKQRQKALLKSRRSLWSCTVASLKVTSHMIRISLMNWLHIARNFTDVKPLLAWSFKLECSQLSRSADLSYESMSISTGYVWLRNVRSCIGFLSFLGLWSFHLEVCVLTTINVSTINGWITINHYLSLCFIHVSSSSSMWIKAALLLQSDPPDPGDAEKKIQHLVSFRLK